MTNKHLQIVSTFTGAGFLDLGFESAGFDTIFANELDPDFFKSYKSNRKIFNKKEPTLGYYDGDVRDLITNTELHSRIKESKNNGLVGMIAGPPCPDFSVGGKNRGSEGDKGKLTQSYFELINIIQPDFFLFENVKGLWRTKKHRAFYEEMKLFIQKSGYYTIDRLFNAIEFGVAQDRDRIIMLGFRKDKFKDPNSWLNLDEEVLFDVKEIKAREWPVEDEFAVDSSRTLLMPDLKEFTVQHWFDENDVENHPNGQDYFTPRSGLAKMLKISEGDVSKKSYKRLHRWRYSPTAAYGNNEVHLHPYKARRISVAEALAIQSLPREYVIPEELTLSKKFKIIGNGVPFKMAQGFANIVQKVINNEEDHS